MDVPRGSRPGLLLLAGLASLALLAGVVPAAARSTATQASSGPPCDAGFLSSSLHLAQVTVDSAVMNTTGTFTSPGQPPLTGLPAFCDVTLTQTDAAGEGAATAAAGTRPASNARAPRPASRGRRRRLPGGTSIIVDGSRSVRGHW